MPDLNLNEFLQPKDSLPASGEIDKNFLFPSEYERGLITTAFIQDAAITTAKIGSAQITNANIATAAIGTANIGTLTFNEIEGGTARLGGTANGDGVLQVFNAGGTKIIQADNTGHHYYVNGTSEIIKVNNQGFFSYPIGSGGTENFSFGTNGIFGYGTISTIIQLRQNPSSGGYYGAIGRAGGAFSLISGSGEDILLSGDDNTSILASNDILISSNSGEGLALGPGFAGAYANMDGGIFIIDGDLGVNGKVTAAGYDPVVEVDGEIFATWSTESPQSLTHYYGTATTYQGEYILDLSNYKKPTEEWLFYKISEEVELFVTPRAPISLYVEKYSDSKFSIRSLDNKDGLFSFHLIGRKKGTETKNTAFGKQKHTELTKLGKSKVISIMQQEAVISRGKKGKGKIKKSLTNHMKESKIKSPLKAVVSESTDK